MHTPLKQRSRSGLTMPLFTGGNLSRNELTRNLSGNIRPQSSQLAEPLWTDPSVDSGIRVRELISSKKTNKQTNSGGEWMVEHSPKILASEKKPPFLLALWFKEDHKQGRKLAWKRTYLPLQASCGCSVNTDATKSNCLLQIWASQGVTMLVRSLPTINKKVRSWRVPFCYKWRHKHRLPDTKWQCSRPSLFDL